MFLGWFALVYYANIINLSLHPHISETTRLYACYMAMGSQHNAGMPWYAHPQLHPFLIPMVTDGGRNGNPKAAEPLRQPPTELPKQSPKQSHLPIYFIIFAGSIPINSIIPVLAPKHQHLQNVLPSAPSALGLFGRPARSIVAKPWHATRNPGNHGL